MACQDPENRKAYFKAYYEANADKLNARNKAYREANADKIKARAKAYYEANADKLKARNKAYYEANIDKEKARNKTYREANTDKIKARAKAYYEANADKAKVKRKAYRQANKQLIHAQTVKRRALKIPALLPTTDDELIKKLYKQRAEMSEKHGEKYHVDHIIPLSIGGAHHQDNMRIITAKENMEKRNKYIPELGGVWADNDLARETKKKLGIK